MPNPPNVVMTCLPEDTPDRRTALADLRAAVCVYAGVALDDIDPASGYDLSERSYLGVLARWTEHFAIHGPCEWTVRECARARAVWARLRPDHLTAYPWLDTDALMEEISHV